MGLFSKRSSNNNRPLADHERPTIDPNPDGDEDFTFTFTATASPQAVQRLDDSIRRAQNSK